jgi:Xaa-Pro aminopeptidase
MNEFKKKQERIRELLAERKLDALLLHRVSSFAWATCGASSYVNTATSAGEAMLLITHSESHLITNNIEATRLEHEEKLVDQGWEFHVMPWYEASDLVEKLAGKGRLGADVPFPGAVNLSGEMARVRANLSPQEIERFRALAKGCAEAMNSAIHNVKPSQSEYQIAAILAQEANSRGIQSIVNLVATDERVYQFRHPLPTDKKLDRYAMLVLCGRRWGLVCSITRLVHFGPLPEELQRKADAVAKIDAVFIDSTRPSRKLSDIFQEAITAYREAGYPDEWKLHHQGGPAGYEPREWVVTSNTEDRVQEGQVYAWNPSITGTKSEDSIFIGESGNEVLTLIEGWPSQTVGVNGDLIERPAILEIPS